MSGSPRDFPIYALHRYAVSAVGRRLVCDKKALSETLDEAKIDSFRTLIDLGDAARKQIRLEVLDKLNMSRGHMDVAKEPIQRLIASE